MKVKGIIALLALAFTLSFSVNAQDYRNRHGDRDSDRDSDREWSRDSDRDSDRDRDHNYYQNQDCSNTVGAPLDGGLLTVLGAAGVAYFVSRKKKNGEVI